ncbi:MAG: TerB family tellurite resistance protein [Gammaproteobacteria bacterium]
MIEKIKQFLSQTFPQTADSESPESAEKSVRIAIAALLVEMSRADFVQEEAEQKILLDLLKDHFFLEQKDAEALLGDAGKQADEAVSLHEFTQAIHAELSEPQKHRFLEMLVQVAMADGKLDKHERHLLSKVADLIYLKRADYVRIVSNVLDGGKTD